MVNTSERYEEVLLFVISLTNIAKLGLAPLKLPAPTFMGPEFARPVAQ